jgi:HEPN domain-containing protein
LEPVSKTVKEWFANANEDLRGALALNQLEPEKYLRIVPYLGQQATEKAIKGYLSYKKIKFTHTHDIGKLATLVLDLRPELEDLMKEASYLSIYAVGFRYPDALKNEPTLKDSEVAIQTVKKGLFYIYCFNSD